MFDEIKEMLPNFPDVVIREWLLPYAMMEDCGWPPPEPMQGHRWNGILALKPLQAWRKCSWRYEERPFLVRDFSCRCITSFVDMTRAYFHGEQNAYSSIKDGKERAVRGFKYLCENGVFPSPLIVVEKDGMFDLMDGNHRVVAMMMFQNIHREGLFKSSIAKEVELQPMWIGSLPEEAACV